MTIGDKDTRKMLRIILVPLNLKYESIIVRCRGCMELERLPNTLEICKRFIGRSKMAQLLVVVKLSTTRMFQIPSL